jgi:hypothetical protein
MPAVLLISALLVIAAMTLLSWRWMEIKGQIEIARAKETRPIHGRVDGLDERVRVIESWVTGEDYQRGMRQLSNNEAIADAVASLPPELRQKWEEGQRHA